MEEKILKALKESNAKTFSELMNWLYANNWELGLEIIDDHTLRERIILILADE